MMQSKCDLPDWLASIQVNVQLLSKTEKDDLNRLVDTMIGFNLAYQQERTIEGQYLFNLEP